MLVDTNVWIALLLPSHPFHHAATTALAAQPRLLLCNSVQNSLLRLLSTPSIQERYGMGTLSNTAVLQSLMALRAHPQVQLITEPLELFATWSQLAAHISPAPKRWMDAYLAALAFHHAVPVLTLDRGFEEFRAHDVQVVILGG